MFLVNNCTRLTSTSMLFQNEKYFQDHGLVKSQSDPNLYIFQSRQDILIVALYVDDLIYKGNSVELFQKFKSHMIFEFEMTDLGELNYFLGIEFWQKEDSIFMSQGKYTRDILKKFKMLSANHLQLLWNSG
jgi:hypothetical protein